MPDNSQLIERLRRKATKRGLAAITHPSLLNEAADTIERLEAELDTTLLRLEGAATQKANLLSRAKKAEQERERDAAVLEALTSESALSVNVGQGGFMEGNGGNYNHNDPVKYGKRLEAGLRGAIQAALQHAQEQVGESDG